MKYYLDNAASTCVDKRVLKAMLPYFTDRYANPSSVHDAGLDVRKAVEKARSDIAKYIGAKAHEIYFTSGVTESNNWAIQGLARVSKHKKTLAISAVEHESITKPAEFLESQDYQVIRIPVDKEGFIDLSVINRISSALMVSVMHANNLFGTIQDIAAIGKICRSKGVLFHTDASQTFGKIPINVNLMHVDLLSGCAHKMGGPKGIGFLYIRDGVKIAPLIFGGGQQKDIRGGTENVPGIVGMAAALALPRKSSNQIVRMQEKFMHQLENIGGVINGSRTSRVPGNVHVSFKGIDATTLLAFLSKKGIYVSTGSACDSKRAHEDYVLRAIGLDVASIRGSIRITLKQGLKEKDVKKIVNAIDISVKKLRSF